MDSLQIAVAAYIAEHGSIDADTFQALTDLYTTEISDDTVINANDARYKRSVTASNHLAQHPNKDSAKYYDETEIKHLNTSLLTTKRSADKIAKECEKISKLKPLTAKSSDDEQLEVHGAIVSFTKAIREIYNLNIEISHRKFPKK